MHHQAELALTQARYEADLARRQFDAVDPANRLVAAELERRWNDRLVDVQRQEERIADLAATHPEALSPAEHDRLLALGADLETAWTHPSATAQTRKRIVRAVLEEIVVKLAADQIELLLHWRGGDHTGLTVPRNRTGQHRWSTDAAVGDLIRGLARQQPDRAIAQGSSDEPHSRPGCRTSRYSAGPARHRGGPRSARGPAHARRPDLAPALDVQESREAGGGADRARVAGELHHGGPLAPPLGVTDCNRCANGRKARCTPTATHSSSISMRRRTGC